MEARSDFAATSAQGKSIDVNIHIYPVEIASLLFIAVSTTREYVSSILSKLQLTNLAAAASVIEHVFIRV